jgi:ribose 5-phosphate isomerase B
MSPTPLFLASDHAGYPLKQALLAWLQENPAYTLTDLGCDGISPSVDYPEYGKALALAMKEAPSEARGILVCGSGVGIVMAANRFPWIRAAHCHDVLLSRLCREHNNANVLGLGGRFVALPLAQELVTTFLNTSHESRHAARVEQLSALG